MQERSLKGFALLSGLDDDALSRLEQDCRWSSYNAGELIFSHLDTSNDIYLLVAGRARAIVYSASGKAVAYRDIVSGQIFGELAAIDGAPRSTSIEAVESCFLAVMPTQVFWKLVDDNRTFRVDLLKHVVTYVRELTDRVFEFSTFAVNNRLHAELLRLAQSATVDGETATITPCPTHNEFANRISTHREAVTREMNRLAKLGVLKQKRRTIVVNDLSRLERMVREALQD